MGKVRELFEKLVLLSPTSPRATQNMFEKD
jgi:hypothetical protein